MALVMVLSVVIAAFVAMEGVAYLSHRFVMHGRHRGAAWHVSHHQARSRRFEANDLYPVVAASSTIVVIAVGSAFEGLSALAWIGSGVTLYGLAYLFVHDLYIHRRVPWFRWRWSVLEGVREAHRIHHLFGGEPYGFLFPVVPRELRARAASTSRDPLLPNVR